jgi:hypothetical protein
MLRLLGSPRSPINRTAGAFRNVPVDRSHLHDFGDARPCVFTNRRFLRELGVLFKLRRFFIGVSVVAFGVVCYYSLADFSYHEGLL